MQKVNYEKTAKLLLYLLVATLILCTGLTITLIARGYQGFASSTSSLPSYFIKKYASSTDFGHHIRQALYSVSVILQIMLIVIVLCSPFGSQEHIAYRQRIKIIIFILVSLTVLTMIPTAIFYISLLCQKSKIGMQIFWDEIFVSIISIVVLILAMICWGVSFKMNMQEKEDNMEVFSKQPKDRKITKSQQDHTERIDLNKRINLNSLMQKQQRIEKIIENVQNESLSSSKGKILQDEIIGDEPIRNALLFKEIIQKINQDPIKALSNKNQSSNMYKLSSFYDQSQDIQNMEKANKRSEFEKIQRENLRALIESRKKKFRDISPNKIQKSQVSEESSYESENIQFKASNLPKTYRQYIKEAKRPKRILHDRVQVQKVIVSMIQTPSKRQPQDEEFSFREIEEAKPKKAGQELIYSYNLKGATRKKKKLFDDLGLSKQQVKLTPFSRKIPKKEPSKQEFLMMRLKQKYSSNIKSNSS